MIDNLWIAICLLCFLSMGLFSFCKLLFDKIKNLEKITDHNTETTASCVQDLFKRQEALEKRSAFKVIK